LHHRGVSTTTQLRAAVFGALPSRSPAPSPLSPVVHAPRVAHVCLVIFERQIGDYTRSGHFYFREEATEGQRTNSTHDAMADSVRGRSGAKLATACRYLVLLLLALILPPYADGGGALSPPHGTFPRTPPSPAVLSNKVSSTRVLGAADPQTKRVSKSPSRRRRGGTKTTIRVPLY
jgi:hypothetical protein